MATRSIHLHPATPGFSMGQIVRRVWAGADAMMRARATRRLLADMDPRLLSDIGVSRGDATMEAARPFWDVTPPLR